MPRTAAALLLALALPVAPASAQRGFTLEQILAAPFPDLLTAAPGGRVAWVLNAVGARNVWIAAPPAYEPRMVTRFAGDDGLELSELAWSADGSALVFTRGTPANSAGEFPNPLGIAAGTAHELWWAPADGAAHKLGDGGDGAISPKDGRVAFVKGGDIWWLEPRDTAAKAELLVNTRGAEALRWSPDGSKLAFVSRRDDHAFVGVVDLAARRVTWVDAGLDNDSDPVWSPDGRSIAFLRQPAAPNAFPFFTAQRTGPPWSIRIADPATGVGHEGWRAEPGPGSVFRGVIGRSQLLWAEGDRLVFPWERDGWTHLYSVPVAGGSATPLTPGDFEVEDVALTGDRMAVVYSSNQNDTDRRHLWRVPVKGGAPVALTKGTGIEWSPAPSGDGKAIVLLRSDARRPPRVAVLIGGEPRDLQSGLIPATYPTAQLVEPTPVVFPAADGLPIHGQLFRPADLKPGERRAAVIYFHGGSRRQMLLGWHYMYYYRNAYAMNQYLASLGFIVLSVNYRSGIGYGLDFREAVNFGPQGASEYQDVTGAGLYLRSRADVLPDRIGLWGGSYGGYLTALGLARASDLFRAGVDIHGVHDWNSEIRNWVPGYDPALRPEFAKRAFEASPLSAVDMWRSPVLLVHGDDDRTVPFSESVRLLEALRARGVEVETLVFPDEVHDFLSHAHWTQAYRAGAEFLSRHLRAEAAPATSRR